MAPFKRKSCTTVGTSGHFLNAETSDSLLPSINIISDTDLSSTSSLCIGKGRFGTCYLQILCHYTVCVKVSNSTNKTAFIHEANILSGFTHKNLPFLFGVCIGRSPSIVTSFHGFDYQSITLHDALYTQSVQIKNLVMDIKCVTILQEIICGLEQLHTKHEILHNDLKEASGCYVVSQARPNPKSGEGSGHSLYISLYYRNAIIVMNFIIKTCQLHLIKMAIASANKSNIQTLKMHLPILCSFKTLHLIFHKRD